MWDGPALRDGSGEGNDAESEYNYREDDVLLRKIAEGCRRSFRRLMERHARSMLALAGRITGSADDADEIVQEAFLKVWAMASKWRPDGGARFSSWLYRVVLNLCLDRRRKRTERSLEGIEDRADPSPGALDTMLARQRQEMLRDAFSDLPVRQRAALSLFYFGELSAPQAARVLCVSVPAMEALLNRGKRSLKKVLVERGLTGAGDFL